MNLLAVTVFQEQSILLILIFAVLTGNLIFTWGLYARIRIITNFFTETQQGKGVGVHVTNLKTRQQ